MNSPASLLHKTLRLILADTGKGIRRVWPSAAATAGLYTVYWIVMLLTGAQAGPPDRVPVVYMAALVFSFCVPSSVYGFINDPSEGGIYAMLPLPPWIKFGTMMLVSAIILPFGFYTAAYILDCGLVLVSGGNGFSGMIWDSGGTDFCSFWSDFGKICLYQSVFILGNIFFRRHKLSLTLLAVLAVHGIFLSIFRTESILNGPAFLIYSYVLPAVIWTVSYLLFKRMQLS